MPPAITSFTQLGPYINSILAANGITVGPPHKDFWDLTYEQFTTGTVPHVVDPATNQPMKILVIGNSADSNLIMALRGTTGSPFDPANGRIPRMPFGGPFWTDDQIAPIAAWIDAGCPQ